MLLLAPLMTLICHSALAGIGLEAIPDADLQGADPEIHPGAGDDPELSGQAVDDDANAVGTSATPHRLLDAPALTAALGGGVVAFGHAGALGLSAASLFAASFAGGGANPAPVGAVAAVFLYVAASPFALVGLAVAPAVYVMRLLSTPGAPPWASAGAFLALVPAAAALAFYIAVPLPLYLSSPMKLPLQYAALASAGALASSLAIALTVPAAALIGDKLLAPKDTDETAE